MRLWIKVNVKESGSNKTKVKCYQEPTIKHHKVLKDYLCYDKIIEIFYSPSVYVWCFGYAHTCVCVYTLGFGETYLCVCVYPMAMLPTNH